MPQVVIVGDNDLAEALELDGADLVRVSALQPGATFDLLLEADLLVDATGDPESRYLANDAAAIRGIPLIWAAPRPGGDGLGEVGVAWDERGADYRDWVATEPASGVASGAPSPALVDAVVLLAGEVLSGAFASRVLVPDAHDDDHRYVYDRDPAGTRPGSLEERTAIREPAADRSVTAEQLAKLLAGPTTEGVHETPPLLLDVRERPEASFASLPGSVLIPLGELPGRLDELDRDARIVVYCHHGVRSGRALEVLEAAGFTRARHLTGGIDAWSVKVDPEVPRY